jgi:hypothetical protein
MFQRYNLKCQKAMHPTSCKQMRKFQILRDAIMTQAKGHWYSWWTLSKRGSLTKVKQEKCARKELVAGDCVEPSSPWHLPRNGAVETNRCFFLWQSAIL